MATTKTDTLTRDFFLGFIRLHLLHHASQDAIFGLDMIRELAEHGYALSPGTLYPILHNLEKDGFLKSRTQVVEGKVRKYYSTTKTGRDALAKAMTKIEELMKEIKG